MFVAIRLQYLFTFSVMGSLLPILSAYLENERGMTLQQVGWVFAIQGAAFVFSPILATYLADTRLDARRILATLYLVAGLMLLATLYVVDYRWIYLTFGIYAIAWVPIMSLQDSVLFGLSKVAERQGGQAPSYHTVRIFGTIGFLIPSLVLYLAMADQPLAGFHLGWNLPMSSCLVVGSIFAFGAFLNTWFLTDPQLRTRQTIGKDAPGKEATSPTKAAHGRRRLVAPPTLEALRVVLKREVLVFLAAMFLLHMSAAAYYNFYPNYLKQLGIDPAYFAIISAAGVAIELAYMASFGWMKKRFGWKWLVIIGACFIALRGGLLAAFPLPGVAIGIQILHGMTVLTLHVMAPVFLESLAAHGYRSSIQGLYQTFIIGGGRMIGSPLAGLIAEHSYFWLYVYAGALGILAAVLILIGFPTKSQPGAAQVDDEALTKSSPGEALLDTHEEQQ